MYSRVWFPGQKSLRLIYSLQFVFCQHYSTSFALLQMREIIMKALDDGNFACGIFVDLQKAFDSVDHNILLSKLSHHGIIEIGNKWFESYLSECKLLVSINGFEFDMSTITYSIPQASTIKEA